jgi:hypothetical protein
MNKEGFFTIEQNYFNLRKQIKMTEYTTPINLQVEKITFIERYKKKQYYNPYFEYKNTDYSEYIKELVHFKELFLKTEHSLSNLYVLKIDDEIEWIKNFSNKHSTFSQWLSSIYGIPQKNVFEYAHEVISNTKKMEQPLNRDLSPIDVKHKIKSEIQNFRFNDWTIEIKNMSARMSVNNLLRTVNINENAVFSMDEVERLFIHEIGTHILRGENGAKQSSLLFKYGFPRYLETEEGLAVFSEELNNLKKIEDMSRYSLRVVACSLCFKMDFYCLFDYIQQFADLEMAFDIVARIKRGLNDTCEFGGYTKDQIYLSGYLKIKELDNSELRKLYMGKIGIDDIKYIEKSNIKIENYYIPKWI